MSYISRAQGQPATIKEFDPATKKIEMVDTCYSTHHLQFARDANNTLWTSSGGGGGVVGWLNTKLWDQTHDPGKSQGWTALVLDTNGTPVWYARGASVMNVDAQTPNVISMCPNASGGFGTDPATRFDLHALGTKMAQAGARLWRSYGFRRFPFDCDPGIFPTAQHEARGGAASHILPRK